MKDLVADRELCQRLVELGVNLVTEYSWCQSPDGKWFLILTEAIPKDYWEGARAILAPTLGEVMRVLPDSVFSGERYELSLYDGNICKLGYFHKGMTRWLKYFLSNTPENSATKNLIYLLEQKLLKPGEVKL